VEGLDVEPAKAADGGARIGQLALAVGRSGRSDGPRASLGVVSSAGGPLRTWRGGRLERYVQTDATPYPGISGGALVDAGGNVLGILTTGLSRGAALAIPADLAWRVASALSERGSMKRGYLGILSQPVRLPDAQGSGLTQRGGLLVVGVEESSPAGQGGMMIGDIVATLDGQPVEDTEDLLVLLAGERVGRTVSVKVIRGGEPKTLEVTVGERG
jgi:S1-C subfamily serine protease